MRQSHLEIKTKELKLVESTILTFTLHSLTHRRRRINFKFTSCHVDEWNINEREFDSYRLDSQLLASCLVEKKVISFWTLSEHHTWVLNGEMRNVIFGEIKSLSYVSLRQSWAILYWIRRIENPSIQSKSSLGMSSQMLSLVSFRLVGMQIRQSLKMSLVAMIFSSRSIKLLFRKYNFCCWYYARSLLLRRTRQSPPNKKHETFPWN